MEKIRINNSRLLDWYFQTDEDKIEFAEGIIKELKEGVDFEELAKEKSDDEASRDSGGDLDLSSYGFTDGFSDFTTRRPSSTDYCYILYAHEPEL